MLGRVAMHAGRVSAWNAARVAGRLRRNAFLYCLVGLFGVTAYAAGILAGGLWLTELYGAVAAAGIIALSTAVLALLLLCIAILVSNLERRREAMVRRESLAAISTAVAGVAAGSRSMPLLLALAGAGIAYFTLKDNETSEES